MTSDQRFDQLSILPGHLWDTSKLHTSGEVNLLSWRHFPLLGDLDGDRLVSADDLDVILNDWGKTVSLGTSFVDPTGDGMVNTFDLALVLDNWGRRLPSAASTLYEPTTLSVLAVSVPLVFHRRREAVNKRSV